MTIKVDNRLSVEIEDNATEYIVTVKDKKDNYKNILVIPKDTGK